MKKLIVSSILCLTTTLSYADTIQIKVDADISIYEASPDATGEGGWYLYIGNHFAGQEYYSLFKFDLTGLTSQLSPGDVLNINSLTFNSYQNYNTNYATTVNGNLYLGTDDNWTPATTTWNTYISKVGSLLTSTPLTPGNKWVSWDLTGKLLPSDFISDNLVTLVLDSDTTGSAGWYDFASREYSDIYNSDIYYSYLDIDYTIQQGGITPVPEPSTIILLSIGVIGMGGYGRKWLNTKGRMFRLV